MLNDDLDLTATQAGRVESARRDLAQARSADLAELPAAALILEVERLRGRLDDMLALIDELCG